MDVTSETTVTALITRHNGLLQQRVADLRRALAIQLLAECLVEVECALAECFPQRAEPHLPGRQPVPHVPVLATINAALENARQVEARHAEHARRRLPRPQLLDEPVVSPIVVADDTLLLKMRNR